VLLLCKVCALVIDLKKCQSSWVLFWFSMKNDFNGATSSKFYFCGVLPPVWVSVAATHFLSRLFL
jgi:hypothetical protein